jgi:hypothetical protein
VVLKLGTLRKVDQKYLESFKVWGWRRMQKIRRTDRVRNETHYIMILEFEVRCTISHPVENSIWKRLWTCRKTDYKMNN